MDRIKRRRPVMAVVAGTLLMLMMGIAYVWGVYVPTLSEVFGWSKVQASLPFSVFLVFYTLGMIFGGRLQDKFGPRGICSVGAFLFGIGYCLSGLASSLFLFCFFYGVVGGIGAGFAYVTPVATAVKWFPSRKGLVSGIVIFGFGAGAFIFSPVVRSLINDFGWKTTFLSLGGVFTVSGLILSRFIRNPLPSEIRYIAESTEAVDPLDISPSVMIRMPVFWRAWSVWLLVLTVGLGLMGHLVAFVTEKGIEPMTAAFLLSIVAIFNGIGRIGTGALSDTFGRIQSLAVACFMLALVSAGLVFAGTNLFLLSILSAIFGLCFGSCLVLYPMIASELFGNRHLGVNYGLLFSSYGFGGLAGPLLFGAFRDSTGGYGLILLISFIVCLTAFFLAIRIRQG